MELLDLWLVSMLLNSQCDLRTRMFSPPLIFSVLLSSIMMLVTWCHFTNKQASNFVRDISSSRHLNILPMKSWRDAQIPPLSNRVNTLNCTTVTDLLFGPYPTICTYGPDEHVSRSYSKKGKTYEGVNVNRFLSLLYDEASDNDVAFIDVGSNFGTYGVNVAARGFPVVFVDANLDNLHLISRSVKMNKLRGIRLINNAVSNTSDEISTFKICEKNVGSTGILGSRELANDCKGRESKIYQVRSITLDDLVNVVKDLVPVSGKAVMKLDIQGFDERSLLRAHFLFEELDIRIIMTEDVTSLMRDMLFARGYKILHPVHFQQFRKIDKLHAVGKESHSKIFWGKI